MTSIRKCIETAGSHYGIEAKYLTCRQRNAGLIEPRWVACWLARNSTKFTFAALGRTTEGVKQKRGTLGYVRDATHYQAQIVVRCERKGKPVSAVGSDEGRRVYRDHWDDKSLESMVRAEAIDVQIPTAAIEDMKERAKQHAALEAPRGVNTAGGPYATGDE